MQTIQEYRKAHPEFSGYSDQKLGEMIHQNHFSDRDQTEFFKEFGVSTSAMAPVSGGMTKEGKLDYDKLSTNREWLNAARIIHENEKGEKFRDSDEQLDEWMKERQADFSSDITNIGLTAYRSKDFDPEVQKAWVKALDIFDNTGANLESFGKSVRHTFTDPTVWGSIPFTVGVGTLGRLVGGRSAAFIARGQFKEQLKRQLTDALVKKGMKKEAAEKAAASYAKKGVSKAVTKHAVLPAARKKAAKAVGKTQMIRGGLAGSAYAGIYDMGHQLTSKRIEREGFEEIDDLQFAGSVLGGAVFGGVLGRFIPSLSERIGRTKALKKAEAQAEQAAKVETQTLEPTARGQIDKNTELRTVQSMANQMQQKLELGGTIDLVVTTNRAATIKAKNKSKNKAWKSSLTNEEIVDAFSSYGIEVTPSTKGQWLGRKVGQQDAPRIPTGEGRSRREKLVGWFGRRFGADSGLGRLGGESRRLMEADTRRAEASVSRRFDRLVNSIKKDYDMSDLTKLENGQYRLMDDVFRGKEEARRTLVAAGRTTVVKSLEDMRGTIKELQKNLLDSGAIKEGSELEIRIDKSFKGEDPELYVTRQYEVFDTPNWGSAIRKNPEVMEKASRYLQGQAYTIAKKAGKDLQKIDEAVKVTTPEGTIYNYSKISPEDAALHKQYFGKDGYIDRVIDSIVNVNGEDDLFKLFDGQGKDNPLAGFGKIFKKRDEIPVEIRDLMGEYKDPFVNYMNTFMKLNQVINTHKYETEIADLVRRGLIEGAGIQAAPSRGLIQPLRGRLPAKIGKRVEQDVVADKPNMVSPLEGLYGTEEVAEAILFGNEITRVTNGFNDNAFGRGLMKYLALQGHTRLAKTVYSPGAIARNFLGAGWMSFGAGYFRAGHVKAMAKLANGMRKMTDEQLNAEIEKATYLGYHQSGVIGPAAYRAALGDAGDEAFWMLNSPTQQGGKALQNRAKRFNMKAVKLYQAMDDVWKRFGFLNEKDNYRKVMVDRAHVARIRKEAGQEISFEDEQLLDAFRRQGGDVYDPEQDIVHTFKTGDGLTVNITRLDKLAADEVSRHMQNYAGVPQFVRYARLLPAADFLAFNTELVRTMKNIWVDTARDIVEGNKLMREGITLPDGTLAGRQQRDVGMRRLGFQIAAQSTAGALGATSLMLVDLDPEEAAARETFVQPYEKGAQWLYLGDQENGEGRRLNMSWLNPYAGATDWLRAGMREMGKGPAVEGKIGQAIESSILDPIYNTLGPSMIAEAALNNILNIDSYGNKLIKDSDDWDERAAKRFGEVWQAYKPGIAREVQNIYGSIVDRPEGMPYAVKKGKSGKKYKTSDQLTALVGVKPQFYDIKPQMGYEIAKHKRNMGDARKVFSNIIQDKSPTTVDELTTAYSESLAKEFREARRIFDVFTRAEEAGLSRKQIRLALTKGGFFDSALDKKTALNMLKTGSYRPPSPVSGDVFKWVHYAKSQRMSPPPVKEALSALMQTYKSYLGAETGVR